MHARDPSPSRGSSPMARGLEPCRPAPAPPLTGPREAHKTHHEFTTLHCRGGASSAGGKSQGPAAGTGGARRVVWRPATARPPEPDDRNELARIARRRGHLFGDLRENRTTFLTRRRRWLLYWLTGRTYVRGRAERVGAEEPSCFVRVSFQDSDGRRRR
jgi:hypothetical protein